MRSLKSLIVMPLLASAMMLAQAPKNPPSPQADKSSQNPARPAGQAGQADRAASPSTSTAHAANSRTFTGTIANANCSQASSLINRTSFADRSGSSSTSTESTKNTPASSTSTDKENKSASDKDNKSVYDLERDVLRHCPATNNTTAFAVVTDDGSFYKLDDAGNTQVTSQAGTDKKKKVKNMRVTVTGTVQGDSLKVQSLTKTDKPFGS